MVTIRPLISKSSNFCTKPFVSVQRAPISVGIASAILLRLIYSYFDIVLMALFYAAIRRDSVSLLRFLFLSHVQVFSREILLDCHLKYPYRSLSSHFCFLAIFLRLRLELSVLFLVTALFVWCARYCVDVSTLSSMLASALLPSFHDTHILSMSSLGCKTLRMHCHDFFCSLVHLFKFFPFKNGSKYLTTGTAHMFKPLMRFLLYSLFSNIFLVLLGYSF